jgi:chromosomal replication initiation ATPase DnaA
MPRQLNFDLTARPALGRDAFFVSEANAVALAMIDDWRGWPGGKLLLTGPQGAGKTHLAHVWAADSGARIVSAATLTGIEGLASGPVCVEDLDRIAGDRARETEAFHLHNLALAQGQPLLLTGQGAVRDWGLALPDLASRLQGTPVARIAPPDEALLGALFAKLFEDRQLSPLPDVMPYLARHAPRDFAAARDIVARMDDLALSEKREISRDLARRVLSLQSSFDFTNSS